ncbi:uncharacterized protein LOC120346262 [Styela clava]
MEASTDLVVMEGLSEFYTENERNYILVAYYFGKYSILEAIALHQIARALLKAFKEKPNNRSRKYLEPEVQCCICKEKEAIFNDLWKRFRSEDAKEPDCTRAYNEVLQLWQGNTDASGVDNSAEFFQKEKSVDIDRSKKLMTKHGVNIKVDYDTTEDWTTFINSIKSLLEQICSIIFQINDQNIEISELVGPNQIKGRLNNVYMSLLQSSNARSYAKHMQNCRSTGIQIRASRDPNAVIVKFMICQGCFPATNKIHHKAMPIVEVFSLLGKNLKINSGNETPVNSGVDVKHNRNSEREFDALGHLRHNDFQGVLKSRSGRKRTANRKYNTFLYHMDEILPSARENESSNCYVQKLKAKKRKLSSQSNSSRSSIVAFKEINGGTSLPSLSTGNDMGKKIPSSSMTDKDTESSNKNVSVVIVTPSKPQHMLHTSGFHDVLSPAPNPNMITVTLSSNNCKSEIQNTAVKSHTSGNIRFISGMDATKVVTQPPQPTKFISIPAKIRPSKLNTMSTSPQGMVLLPPPADPASKKHVLVPISIMPIKFPPVRVRSISLDGAAPVQKIIVPLDGGPAPKMIVQNINAPTFQRKATINTRPKKPILVKIVNDQMIPVSTSNSNSILISSTTNTLKLQNQDSKPSMGNIVGNNRASKLIDQAVLKTIPLCQNNVKTFKSVSLKSPPVFGTSFLGQNGSHFEAKVKPTVSIQTASNMHSKAPNFFTPNSSLPKLKRIRPRSLSTQQFHLSENQCIIHVDKTGMYYIQNTQGLNSKVNRPISSRMIPKEFESNKTLFSQRAPPADSVMKNKELTSTFSEDVIKQIQLFPSNKIPAPSCSAQFTSSKSFEKILNTVKSKESNLISPSKPSTNSAMKTPSKRKPVKQPSKSMPTVVAEYFLSHMPPVEQDLWGRLKKPPKIKRRYQKSSSLIPMPYETNYLCIIKTIEQLGWKAYWYRKCRCSKIRERDAESYNIEEGNHLSPDDLAEWMPKTLGARSKKALLGYLRQDMSASENLEMTTPEMKHDLQIQVEGDALKSTPNLDLAKQSSDIPSSSKSVINLTTKLNNSSEETKNSIRLKSQNNKRKIEECQKTPIKPVNMCLKAKYRKDKDGNWSAMPNFMHESQLNMDNVNQDTSENSVMLNIKSGLNFPPTSSKMIGDRIGMTHDHGIRRCARATMMRRKALVKRALDAEMKHKARKEEMESMATRCFYFNANFHKNMYNSSGSLVLPHPMCYKDDPTLMSKISATQESKCKVAHHLLKKEHQASSDLQNRREIMADASIHTYLSSSWCESVSSKLSKLDKHVSPNTCKARNQQNTVKKHSDYKSVLISKLESMWNQNATSSTKDSSKIEEKRVYQQSSSSITSCKKRKSKPKKSSNSKIIMQITPDVAILNLQVLRGNTWRDSPTSVISEKNAKFIVSAIKLPNCTENKHFKSKQTTALCEPKSEMNEDSTRLDSDIHNNIKDTNNPSNCKEQVNMNSLSLPTNDKTEDLVNPNEKTQVVFSEDGNVTEDTRTGQNQEDVEDPFFVRKSISSSTETDGFSQTVSAVVNDHIKQCEMEEQNNCKSSHISNVTETQYSENSISSRISTSENDNNGVFIDELYSVISNSELNCEETVHHDKVDKQLMTVQNGDENFEPCCDVLTVEGDEESLDRAGIECDNKSSEIEPNETEYAITNSDIESVQIVGLQKEKKFQSYPLSSNVIAETGSTREMIAHGSLINGESVEKLEPVSCCKKASKYISLCKTDTHSSIIDSVLKDTNVNSDLSINLKSTAEIYHDMKNIFKRFSDASFHDDFSEILLSNQFDDMFTHGQLQRRFSAINKMKKVLSSKNNLGKKKRSGKKKCIKTKANKSIDNSESSKDLSNYKQIPVKERLPSTACIDKTKPIAADIFSMLTDSNSSNADGDCIIQPGSSTVNFYSETSPEIVHDNIFPKKSNREAFTDCDSNADGHRIIQPGSTTVNFFSETSPEIVRGNIFLKTSNGEAFTDYDVTVSNFSQTNETSSVSELSEVSLVDASVARTMSDRNGSNSSENSVSKNSDVPSEKMCSVGCRRGSRRKREKRNNNDLDGIYWTNVIAPNQVIKAEINLRRRLIKSEGVMGTTVERVNKRKGFSSHHIYPLSTPESLNAIIKIDDGSLRKFAHGVFEEDTDEDEEFISAEPIRMLFSKSLNIERVRSWIWDSTLPKPLNLRFPVHNDQQPTATQKDWRIKSEKSKKSTSRHTYYSNDEQTDVDIEKEFNRNVECSSQPVRNVECSSSSVRDAECSPSVSRAYVPLVRCSMPANVLHSADNVFVTATKTPADIVPYRSAAGETYLVKRNSPEASRPRGITGARLASQMPQGCRVYSNKLEEESRRLTTHVKNPEKLLQEPQVFLKKLNSPLSFHNEKECGMEIRPAQRFHPNEHVIVDAAKVVGGSGLLKPLLGNINSRNYFQKNSVIVGDHAKTKLATKFASGLSRGNSVRSCRLKKIDRKTNSLNSTSTKKLPRPISVFSEERSKRISRITSSTLKSLTKKGPDASNARGFARRNRFQQHSRLLMEKGSARKMSLQELRRKVFVEMQKADRRVEKQKVEPNKDTRRKRRLLQSIYSTKGSFISRLLECDPDVVLAKD